MVIVFELDSIDAAKRYTDDFPLTRVGFLEWFFISLQVPRPIEVSDGRRVMQRVRSVLEAARRGGYRVFFTRHMSLPNEVAGVVQLRTAISWQRVDSVDKVNPTFLRERPGFQIAPELGPLPSEGVIDKITMSAFVGTPLRSFLPLSLLTQFDANASATFNGKRAWYWGSDL